ncbi:MAG: hypothetical protein EBR09_09690 [Proteobacteria bacterium]|nr:hypothetical protein [Pseudomonadota bacterium]
MSLLKNSEWAFLLDFVSPAFFKVIPPVELFSNATALAKRTRDHKFYEVMISDVGGHFAQVLPEVKVIAGTMTHCGSFPSPHVTDLVNAGEAARKHVASRIVEIYFAQILAGRAVFLDVRLNRFAVQDSVVYWSPAPLTGVFSDEFLAAMGELYKGYYGGEPERMKSALSTIGLDWAYDVFIAHFGEGDQSDVRFAMSHFVHTFHDIFMLCKKNRKNLRGEFVQLGVILGLMYESLERLGVSVDVRSAFMRVLKNPDTGSDQFP